MTSTSIRDIVAKNIKYYRVKKGLSQEKLSKKCGLSVRFISRAENQPQNLTLETLQILAESLEISVSDLTQWPEQKKSSKSLRKSKSTEVIEALEQTIKLLQAYIVAND